MGATELPVTTQQNVAVQISEIWNTVMRNERKRARDKKREEGLYTLLIQTHLNRLLWFFSHFGYSKDSDLAAY